ncbi:MAG: AraC family transcriptional regulator [Verrucomicrobia bacterium]|nr:AraC family transcriptional regulator [Verrucomicrobiota bacterium]
MANPRALVEKLHPWRSWQPPVPKNLERVAEHIEAHLDTRLAIQALARLAGMSPAGFNRAFRSQFGTSPARYVTELRVREAARRLLQDDETIHVIAENTGFPNRAYFSRLFEFAVEGQVAHPERPRDAFDIVPLYKKFTGLSGEIRQVRLVRACGREALRDYRGEQGHCQAGGNGPVSQLVGQANIVQLGKSPPKSRTTIHMHGSHIQNAMPEPCFECGAAQLKPVLGPARFWVGPITVPVTGRKQENRARGEARPDASRFQRPESLRYCDQLECREDPAALPGKRAPFRMPWRRVGVAGKDAGMTDR